MKIFSSSYDVSVWNEVVAYTIMHDDDEVVPFESVWFMKVKACKVTAIPRSVLIRVEGVVRSLLCCSVEPPRQILTRHGTVRRVMYSVYDTIMSVWPW